MVVTSGRDQHVHPVEERGVGIAAAGINQAGNSVVRATIAIAGGANVYAGAVGLVVDDQRVVDQVELLGGAQGQ